MSLVLDVAGRIAMVREERNEFKVSDVRGLPEGVESGREWNRFD